MPNPHRHISGDIHQKRFYDSLDFLESQVLPYSSISVHETDK